MHYLAAISRSFYAPESLAPPKQTAAEVEDAPLDADPEMESELPSEFDPAKTNQAVTLSEDKRTMTKTHTGWDDGTSVVCGPGLVIPENGTDLPKKIQRWTFRIDKAGQKATVGVVTAAFDTTTDGYVNKTKRGWGYYMGNGNCGHGGPANTRYGKAYSDGSIIIVEVDAEARTVRFFKDGVDQGVAGKNLPRGTTYFGASSLYNKGDKVTLIPPEGSTSPTPAAAPATANANDDDSCKVKFFEASPKGTPIEHVYPFNTYYKNRRCQCIYMAKDINSSGLKAADCNRTIRSVQLMAMKESGTRLSNFRIEYAFTLRDQVDNWVKTKPCYTPKHLEKSRTSKKEWLTFELDTPIEWDGVQNLLLQFSYNGNSNTSDKGKASAVTAGKKRMLRYCTDSGYTYPFKNSSDGHDDALPRARLGFEVEKASKKKKFLSKERPPFVIRGTQSVLLMLTSCVRMALEHVDSEESSTTMEEKNSTMEEKTSTSDASSASKYDIAGVVDNIETAKGRNGFEPVAVAAAFDMLMCVMVENDEMPNTIGENICRTAIEQTLITAQHSRMVADNPMVRSAMLRLHSQAFRHLGAEEQLRCIIDLLQLRIRSRLTATASDMLVSLLQHMTTDKTSNPTILCQTVRKHDFFHSILLAWQKNYEDPEQFPALTECLEHAVVYMYSIMVAPTLLQLSKTNIPVVAHPLDDPVFLEVRVHS